MLSQKTAAALRSARRRIFKRNFGTVFLVVLIFYYNGLLRRHYLTRQGIVPSGLSPWTHLLLNAHNGSILGITGFDRLTFMLLVQCLKITDETPGRRKRGRPPSLDFVGQVGLILLFLQQQSEIEAYLSNFWNCSKRMQPVHQQNVETRNSETSKK